MSAHTPGPWFEQGNSVYAATPQDVPAGFRGFSEPEIPGGYLIAESIPHDATRRLIAAAPELLFALRTVMGDFEDVRDGSRRVPLVERLKIGRAAIDKAMAGGAS